MTQIFLQTTGVANAILSFPDPGDWNPANNKVECIGHGSAGLPGFTGATPGGGGGGGGGDYGINSNFVPTAWPVSCAVPHARPYGDANRYYSGFGVTAWNSRVGAYVWARGGIGPQSGTSGGNPGADYGPTGIQGGFGGSGSQVQGPEFSDPRAAGDKGAGGGGAGGPHGQGGSGDGAKIAGGVGGVGDGGFTASAAVGANGNAGTQFDALHGCGGGGGGSAGVAAGGNGGQYGGSGGGGSTAFTTSGVGGDGLIVITYIVAVPTSSGFNMPMMGM